MVNKLKELREKVKAEMEHIPKGNTPQMELRMYYWPGRMHSLGKKAKSNETKEDVLKKSIERVKQYYRDFVPQYDKKFFRL